MEEIDYESLARERFSLFDQIKVLERRIKEIEEITGISKIRRLDHIQGTNVDEYICTVCKSTLISSGEISLCPVCHPPKEI